jgi:glutamine synthetase
MPKPIFGDNGSGMHTHQSLWKDGKPLFYDESGYGGLSDIARWYIGGLLKHAPVAAGLHQPDGQLLPPPRARLRGAGQPGLLGPQPLGVHPHPDRRHVAQGQAHRVPRPDPSANPYLAFAAQLMAGLDGIKNRIEPPEPIDKDLYELPPEEHAEIKPRSPVRCPRCSMPSRPTTSTSSKGGVFTKDLIETWIEWKRKNEVDPIRFRPHPHEFEMYFDI